MAESPLGRLARLVGGVVLMQGRLGHQVLGQLLLFDTDDAAVAGATVVVAATTRQQNAILQAAIRTAVPAIAARAIINRDLERLAARELLVEEQLRRIKERERAVSARELLESARPAVVAARRLLAPRFARDFQQRIAELEQRRDKLEQEKVVLAEENSTLEARVSALSPVAPVAPAAPAAPATPAGLAPGTPPGAVTSARRRRQLPRRRPRGANGQVADESLLRAGLPSGERRVPRERSAAGPRSPTRPGVARRHGTRG